MSDKQKIAAVKSLGFRVRKSKDPDAPFGYCAKCGQVHLTRDGGIDTCKNGHRLPSGLSVGTKWAATLRKREEKNAKIL